MRAFQTGDMATVKVLMKHPMHTGLQKDKKTGKLIPAHFIQQIHCELNGSPVMTIDSGPAVSKNPYLSFRIRGAKQGDTVKVSWVDNKGAQESAEAVVSE